MYFSPRTQHYSFLPFLRVSSVLCCRQLSRQASPTLHCQGRQAKGKLCTGRAQSSWGSCQLCLLNALIHQRHSSSQAPLENGLCSLHTPPALAHQVCSPCIHTSFPKMNLFPRVCGSQEKKKSSIRTKTSWDPRGRSSSGSCSSGQKWGFRVCDEEIEALGECVKASGV